MADKRKFERLPARLEVEIRTRGRGQVCPSVDVSRHGMFLTTANPPLERQLLILRIPLPQGVPPIDVMASVVRRVTPEDAVTKSTPGGIGINFFALTEENKNHWDNYLARLRGQTPREPLPGGEHASRATFLLQPKDVDRLRLFAARELALGSMFLRTPVLRHVGETLKVVLLHPESDEEFPLVAKVRSTHEGTATEPKGMTLDFEPLPPELRDSIHDFVEHGTPPLGETPLIATVSPEPAPGDQAAVPPVQAEAPSAPVEEPISEELAASAVGAVAAEAPKSAPEVAAPTPDVSVGADEQMFAPVPIRQRLQDLADEPGPATPESRAETTEKESPAKPDLALQETPAAPAAELAASESFGRFDEKSREAMADIPIQGLEPLPLPPAPSERPPPPEDPAVAQLRDALLIAPEDVGLLFRLGNALARRSSTAAEALEVLTRLQTVEPHHPLANGALALAYAQLGERMLAERHLTRARRLGQPVDAHVQTLLLQTA